MRTAWASSLRRLGASLLAVMLCAVLVQPAQAITSNSHFTPAIPVAEKTAYTGVLVVIVEPCTGLFGADNPVMGTDPSGNKTVIVVTDADNKGSGDQTAADKAASHLQKAGWSVTDVEAGNFINIKGSFDGVIMSGHGDETQSAAITVDVLESMCKQTGSKLDVGIALSCHGIDFISKVTRDGYTTPTALVLGYWGYSLNSPGRTYRVGKIIDKWVANPTYTSVSLGNIGTDMGGEGGALAKKVGIGILNMLDAIDLDGIMD